MYSFLLEKISFKKVLVQKEGKQNVTKRKVCPLLKMIEILPGVSNPLKPFMPSEIFYLNSLNRSISYIGVSGWLLLLSFFVEIPVFNANSIDPDQTPRSAASDLGLHCLPMSLL